MILTSDNKWIIVTMTLDYYNNGGGQQVPLSIVTLTFDGNHLYFAYRSEKFDMGGLNSFPYQTYFQSE